MVGSEKSYTATDLSKRTERTDRTSYSIPDDGRAITIQTDRRRRRRENQDTQSVLSHGTNTSLLIEYFENGKPGSGSTGRQPSVRVKVTPSAAKRHRVNQSADGTGVEISEVGNGDKPGRRPTHTHRIQLSPHSGEDRLTLGQTGRSRSYSGDHSTLSSFTSGADDSNMGRGPVNVTVIREANSPGPMFSLPRDMDGADYGERRRRRRTASRSGTGDSYYEENFKVSKQVRSRSVSRESEIYEEPGLKAGLNRRRSRSLSRERISMSQKEKIEQAVRDELHRVKNPKSRKDRSKSRTKAYDNDSLKPPRARSRSRSRERHMDEIAAEKARARRKAAQIEGDDRSTGSNGTHTTANPALVELIRGTIRELLLPEIEEMKASQKREAGRPGMERTLGRNLSTKGPGRALSMPDVGKPVVVLSPDVDKNSGMGMVISGGDKGSEYAAEDDISHSRAPGFGLPHSPLPSESGEGVSLVGAMPTVGEERVNMPEIPFRSDTPGTYAETRLSIRTAKSGFPYPAYNGMPSTGITPPPGDAKSEFPELSELNLGGSEIGGASTLLSDRSIGRSYLSKTTGLGIGAPSIASLNLETEVDHDDNDRVSATSSATKAPGYSELSFQTLSIPPSTVFAKERKDKGRRKKDFDELSDIRGSEEGSTSSKVNQVDLFFAEQREREQERALLNPNLQDRSLEVRHVSTVTGNSFEGRRVDTGHHVFDLGANPSMRSTPVIAHSAVASVLDPSNVGSALSLNRPNSRPQLGSSALPIPDDPMPEFGHHADDDEDINTNPSIIQGPIGHHQPASWGMTNDFGDRGLNIDLEEEMRETPISPQPNSRLASPPLGKDEGYISAANPIGSPGTATPVQGMRGDAGMGAIDDMLSDADFYHGHQRNRLGSGNSHGMPSPLYDSATGRGIERIESKDIFALMEHLTVRDAQRNARDTEILVTLVRSAAEMRNSFEDMKKALADQRRDIVSDVDHNTERSVQKLLQGPRPLPPSTPRRTRYSKSDEDAEEEGRAKRASVFKRALKGLSMGSSKDLERIEEMLCKLLGEVEGLKDGQQFYQQSALQSQSMGTIDQLRIAQDSNEAAPSTSFANNSVGNSGYHSAGPSRQPSGRIYDQHQPNPISPIQEDAVLDTQPRETQGESLPLDTPPNPNVPAVSVGNTPTKSSEKHAKRESGSSSIFPRVSRWSETTASTGFKNFLSKGKINPEGSEASHSQPDFNFWETEAAKGTQGDLLHQSPFDSDGQRTERVGSPLVPPSLRDTDAPINQSNRISLDIQHPRPRVTYNHQLEQQAQELTAEGAFMPSSPQNASVSSLGNYPPLGPGGFQNGKLFSPLAQDAYAQRQAQMTPNGPPRPPIVVEDVSQDDSSTRKHKKHRERDENGDKIKKPKKERTEEEKQRRREKKERRERDRESGGSSTASKKKSRDLLSDGTDGPSISGRTLSTASRLNGPRPLSSASNKENSRRHRQHSSQAADDTFGTGGDYDYGSYR